MKNDELYSNLATYLIITIILLISIVILITILFFTGFEIQHDNVEVTNINTVPDDSTIIKYEELDNNYQETFRTAANQDRYTIGDFPDVDYVSLDGEYYSINTGIVLSW